MAQNPRILVVDDAERNLRLMEAILLPQGYEVILASDGEEALQKVRETYPDVILLDIMMPKMDGFELAGRLKSSEDTQTIPIVMVTALHSVGDRIKALEAGADDFLSKPVDPTELRARVRSLLKVKAYNDYMKNYQRQLEAEVAKRTKALQSALEQLREASLDTIRRLARAAEYKDENTGAHILRISYYAAAIARTMGQKDSDVEAILYASPMHDIGKIGIPDRILLKQGELTPEEWEVMKEHTNIGGQILAGSDSELLQLAEKIAYTHHEKWDGSGYPKGLRGEEIPLVGRITAIVDVFDALTSKRPYKKAFSVERAFGIIRAKRGGHFDPNVVDAFFAVKEEILSIMRKHES